MFNPMAVHKQEVPSGYVYLHRGRKMGMDPFKTSWPPTYLRELSFVFPNSLNILYVHAYSLFICLLVHPE